MDPMQAPAAQSIAAPGRSPLLVVGLVGAVLAAIVTLVITWAGWGQPGTAEYEMYELLNRLAALPMLLMAAAPLALLGMQTIRDERRGTIAAVTMLVGLVAMAVGTSAEFWIFTDEPYSGSGSEGRLASYLLGTFLGGVVALVGMALVGTWGLRRATLPRWTAIALIGLPIALVVLPFTPLSPYLAIPAGVLLVTTALLASDR
jgi:hypothetical protein